MQLVISAEYNIADDVAAAAAMYNASWSIATAPLDVTIYVCPTHTHTHTINKKKEGYIHTPAHAHTQPPPMMAAIAAAPLDAIIYVCSNIYDILT